MRLSDDPNDIGDVNLSFHRKQIFSFFQIPKEEWPISKSDQLTFLKTLKANDPKKYNDAYDVIVNRIIPKEKVIEYEPLPGDIVDDAIKKFKEKTEIEFKKFKTIGDTLSESTDNKLSEIVSTTLETMNKYVENVESKIQKASEEIKIKRTEIIIRNNNEKIKLDDVVVPENFSDILDLASNRVNILLVGPAGCGKTYLSSIVAKSLGLKYSGQSCSAGMSESIFSGWLLPTEENGRFNYVESAFINIYENGGVFLFDEIDAADPNTLLFLNQALANSEFFLPQRYENPTVKKHKDFVAIAAANTHGNGASAMYSGRNMLDGATMDRFRAGIIPMDYSDVVEEKLIDSDLLDIGRKIRKHINKHSMRKILSTRFLLDATKMKNSGWDFEKIFDSYFSDWSEEEKKLVDIDNLLTQPRQQKLQNPMNAKTVKDIFESEYENGFAPPAHWKEFQTDDDLSDSERAKITNEFINIIQQNPRDFTTNRDKDDLFERLKIKVRSQRNW